MDWNIGLLKPGGDGVVRWLGRMATVALASLLDGACSPEQSFREEMKRRLEAKHQGAVLTTAPNEPLSLKVEKNGDYQEGTINLHRIYEFCRNAAAQECERGKAEFVDKMVLTEPTFAADRLRLLVRDSAYMDYVRSLDGPAAQVVSERIGDDLYALLASDNPTTIAMVTVEELRTMKLSRRDAWNLALKQTRAGLPPIPTAAALRGNAVAIEG